MQKALATLNQVTFELIEGVEEEDLVHRYRGKYVAPGVTVPQHLKELAAGRCLRREGNKIFLKDECNPKKLLPQAV